MALKVRSAVPISTALICLHDRLPSAATLLVQPLQLHDLVPSVYCRVWYSTFALESEAKLQTRVICLFMSAVEVFFLSLIVDAPGLCDGEQELTLVAGGQARAEDGIQPNLPIIEAQALGIGLGQRFCREVALAKRSGTSVQSRNR